MDIVTLATKVQNGVAAMEALNHIGYLHSPGLVGNIIKKLPWAIVYHYNRFLWNSDSDEPRLVTISRFLQHDARMANETCTSKMTEPNRNPPVNQSTEKRKPIQQRVLMFSLQVMT